MKRQFALLLAVLLLLTACGQKPETKAPETTEASSAPTEEAAPEMIGPEPTEPAEPDTEPAVILAPSYGVLYGTANRGECLAIVGEEGWYYKIDFGGFEGYVAKRLVRWNEPVPEIRTAYAGLNAVFNSSVYFNGFEEPLKFNQELTVLDEFADWMLVEVGEKQGYIKADQVNAAPIRSGYSEEGGGGGGGGEDRIDGGDIYLSASGSQEYRVQLLADTNIGTVLADGTEIYERLLSVDDPVRVMETIDKLRVLWEAPNIGTVDKRIAFMEGDTPYETWKGYAKWNARFYPDHWCLYGGTQLNTNTEVEVMLDLGEIYMVKFQEELGFMHRDDVMKYRAVADEGGGGGSDSGKEWTDPIL